MKTLKEFTKLEEGLDGRVGQNVRFSAHKLWGSLEGEYTRGNVKREKEIMDEFKKELKSLGYKGKF